MEDLEHRFIGPFGEMRGVDQAGTRGVEDAGDAASGGVDRAAVGEREDSVLEMGDGIGEVLGSGEDLRGGRQFRRLQ